MIHKNLSNVLLYLVSTFFARNEPFVFVISLQTTIVFLVLEYAMKPIAYGNGNTTSISEIAPVITLISYPIATTTYNNTITYSSETV